MLAIGKHIGVSPATVLQQALLILRVIFRGGPARVAIKHCRETFHHE